jgi:lipopolysaccharide/colanic/teichoic acid biosynthesis glycosyltransferase
MISHTALEHPRRRRTDAPPSYQASTPTVPSELRIQAANSDALRARINFWIAAVALVLLMPLMLLVAVAVKLTSKGPIIYTQPRVGLDRREDTTSPSNYRRVKDLGGMPFRIYKFRSMTVEAEKGSGAVWASKDDRRVTWVGKILRKARLDELPQFFNVLKGEMSIVGPRPERPAIFADLKAQVDNYQGRQRALPGITGLAQISQAYDTSIEDVRSKVMHDLKYIEHQNVKEDLRIMLKTIPVVLFRRGGW